MEKLAFEMVLFRVNLMRNTGPILLIQGFPTLAEPWEWKLSHKQQRPTDAKRI